MSNEEHETTEFDVPNGAEYAGYPITEIGYNHDLDTVYVIYEDDEEPDGWDQLIFGATLEGGEARVTDVPAGLVSPERMNNENNEAGIVVPSPEDRPGWTEAARLYELLESVGVTVFE